MKLQNLHEASIDRSKYMKDFSADGATAVEGFISKLESSGLKVISYSPGHKDKTEVTIKLTSGVFNLVVDLSLEVNLKYRYYVSILIDKKYHATAESHFKDEVAAYFESNLEEAKLLDTLDEIAKAVVDTINSLTEWYMDVTGEYGKVKIYADWRGERKVTAIAGEFIMKDNKGQVY